MKNKPVFTTENIAPAVVILLSLMNLSNHTDDFISLSVFLSLIGITGAILFFRKNPLAIKLIYIWIIAQVIAIEPLFDLTQGFSLKFGFTLGLHDGDVSVNINALAFLMLGFIKILEAANLVGKKITLKKFRDGELEGVFPINGTITERIALENEKNWVLVALDTPIMYDGQNVTMVLTKRKDDKTIKLKEKNQVSFLRLVLNDSDLQNRSDKSKFPFIDWIYCE